MVALRRLLAVAAFAIAMVAISSVASAHITSTKVVTPPKHVRHDRRFHPVEHPDPSRVPYIEREEQKRWGGPWIGRRSMCESGNRWWASSAGVMGIIATSWWYHTALPRTPRGVKLTHIYYRHRPIRRVTRYSNGARHVHKIGRVRQRIKVVRHGHLDTANQQSTWLAIRVSQRAVSGDGPPASWQCSL